VLGELLADHPRPHLFQLAGAQGAQGQRPVRQADQPVHLQADGLQDLADLAVLALVQGDREPEVGALRPLLGFVEPCLDRTIADAVDGHALLQGVQPVLGRAAVRAGAVTADDPRGRHLQRPRQLTVVGQQQQAFGVDVEAPHRDQPRHAGGQRLEHRRPIQRILVRRHQPHGLVIAEQARGLGLAHHVAVDGDDVAGLDLHAGRIQRTAVDGHPALGDQALDVAARTDAGAGQQLGDALPALGVEGAVFVVVGLTWVVALGS